MSAVSTRHESGSMYQQIDLPVASLEETLGGEVQRVFAGGCGRRGARLNMDAWRPRGGLYHMKLRAVGGVCHQAIYVQSC